MASNQTQHCLQRRAWIRLRICYKLLFAVRFFLHLYLHPREIYPAKIGLSGVLTFSQNQKPRTYKCFGMFSTDEASTHPALKMFVSCKLISAVDATNKRKKRHNQVAPRPKKTNSTVQTFSKRHVDFIQATLQRAMSQCSNSTLLILCCHQMHFVGRRQVQATLVGVRVGSSCTRRDCLCRP